LRGLANNKNPLGEVAWSVAKENGNCLRLMILVFWDCRFPSARLGNPPWLEAPQTARIFAHTRF
jgi:hypothetical protein